MAPHNCPRSRGTGLLPAHLLDKVEGYAGRGMTLGRAEMRGVWVCLALSASIDRHTSAPPSLTEGRP